VSPTVARLLRAITCITCNGHGYLGGCQIVAARAPNELIVEMVGHTCATCRGTGVQPSTDDT
jgi:hypothetical protein